MDIPAQQDDKLIIARMLDKARLAEKIRQPSCSDFLDPHQQSVVERALAEYDNIEYSLYGGYHGAERAMAVFSPDFVDSDDEWQEYSKFLKIVNIIPTSRDNLSHRDYLGALLSLGIKREKTGDLLVREESCDVFVMAEIAGFIRSNLTKVGNSRVVVSIKDVGEITVPEQKVKEINVTVASLRLDCITGPGFGMSRSKAAEYIKAGKLSLNWEVTENPSRTVKEGDTVTIRGRGRVVLESVGKKTKKDRIGVILKKHI